MQQAAASGLYDRTVSDLYRAAAGEVPWGQAFEGSREICKAWGVIVQGVRLSDGAVAFAYEVGGFPPEAALAYLRHYHRFDPRMDLVKPLQIGEWTSCHEHLDDAYVARSPFYQDFLIPVGGRYCSGAKVYQDDELVVVMGVHRQVSSEPLGADDLVWARRIGDHVRTAMGLWRRQRDLLKASLAGNALLDRLRQPIVLVDEQLQLHYRNAAATELLASDHRLRLVGESLACQQSGGTKDLMLALRRIRLGGEASYRNPGEPETRAVVRAGDGVGVAPLLLLTSALRPNETMGAFGPRSLAMVLVHDPAAPRHADPLVVAEAYRLTPAESVVAAAIADGKSVQQIAARHRVAVSTVRTQVNGVMSKMGVRRQSEVAGAINALPALLLA